MEIPIKFIGVFNSGNDREIIMTALRAQALKELEVYFLRLASVAGKKEVDLLQNAEKAFKLAWENATFIHNEYLIEHGREQPLGSIAEAAYRRHKESLVHCFAYDPGSHSLQMSKKTAERIVEKYLLLIPLRSD